MELRGIGALLVVALAAIPCAAQLPNDGPLQLDVSPLISGGMGSASTAGGIPAAPWWIALDTDTGMRTIPGTAVVFNLAMTPQFFLLPVQWLDVNGNGALSVPVTANPVSIGEQVYIQAMTVDPVNPVATAVVSNLVHTGIHPPAVSGGQLTSLGNDDDEVYPYLMQAMSFTFYGTTYDTLHVSSNGRISFNGGDPLSIENATEFLAEEPSVGVLWDDLDPSSGGSVTVLEDTGGAWVRVSWTAVPQYGFGDASTAHCTLYADGSLTLTYGAVTVQDGLIGISPGNNLSLAGAMDLSALCWHAPPTGSAIYEVFSGASVFDCANSGISIVPLASSKYTVIGQ